jgi:hypothetical protein
MSLKLRGGGKLLRHFHITRIKGQNALSVDLNREQLPVQNLSSSGKSRRAKGSTKKPTISESSEVG